MMEKKFRAWDKKQKKWLAFDNGDGIGFDYELMGDNPDGSSHWAMFFAVEDIEIIQYTGLKDKNGKEIYEGDIIRINLGKLFVVKFGFYQYSNGIDYFTEGNGFFKEREEIGYREGYEEGKAKFIYLLKTPLYKLDENAKYEIMGNIYENPDFRERELK